MGQENLKMKRLLICLWMLFHICLSTPVKDDEKIHIDLNSLEDDESWDQLVDSSFSQHRSKRQVPNFDNKSFPPPLNPQEDERLQRQRFGEEELPVNPNCDFENNEDVSLCDWSNLEFSSEKWRPSMGENSGSLGGPLEDHTSPSDKGGYALYDTRRASSNQFSQSVASDSAMLMSPLIPETRAIGQCISFWYSMNGLSQDRIRILLRPPAPFLFGAKGHQNMSNDELTRRLEASDGRGDIVLWEQRDSTDGNWVNGQVVYTLLEPHLIIFEGLPLSMTDTKRSYRGYIALDDLQFIDASDCKPFCNFEGGLCSWSQDQNDDFDWSVSQGSINPLTGPAMDRFSSNYVDYGVRGGSYAFIDSSYPRRPSDKARLLSEVFERQEMPLCMRFWTHMFGIGIGSLRILIDPSNGDEETIWELKGEQGNNWYQAQVTITALSDFQIVIEAEVGENNMGDIAIDEIALKENACPTSPQTASKFLGDCTFEVDECGWQNVESRLRMDELDWERTVASQARAPSKDHTLKSTQGYFITLPRNTVQRGERGWLVSPQIKPTGETLCMSFWYFMLDPLIETTGPALGSLMVILMEQDESSNNQGFQTLTPLWKVKNHQGLDWQYGQTSIKTDKTFMILFEGLWGNSRGNEFIALDDITFFVGNCLNKPDKSTVSFLDCDFTRDTCSYMNASSGGRNAQWTISSISRRPSALGDHTYGGPVGYLYFDVFNSNQQETQKVTLMSRVIRGSRGQEPICLTFWYAPTSNDPNTKLIINREAADASSNEADTGNGGNALMIWSVRASDVYDGGRVEWFFGQTQLAADSDFKISFVGEARNQGFAIDDIEVVPGICNTRPPSQEFLS